MEDKIMFKTAKKILIIMMIAAMIIMPLATTAVAGEYFEAEDPSGGVMMFDLVAVRPIAIVASAIGCVIFVVSSPFSALGGNIDSASEKLVKDPLAYTFTRPLGEFESVRRGQTY
jgi:hypothetical protein